MIKHYLKKINVYSRREKFRIRYYNDNFDFIRLEKKSKVNNLCTKFSAPLTKEQCEKILNIVLKSNLMNMLMDRH